jgi:hypothetical protein
MYTKRDKIVIKKAKLDKKMASLQKKIEAVNIEYQKLQLDCGHWERETEWGGGLGMIPDNTTTCKICGKVL